MIKKFSSPKIKIWFEPMFFFGFLCGFDSCGSAAFPDFRGGTSSPPAAGRGIDFSNVVPRVGIEPTRSCDHKILSLARMPVSPQRHI